MILMLLWRRILLLFAKVFNHQNFNKPTNYFFFLTNGSQLSSLTKEECDSEVIAHGIKLTSILCSISIKDSVEYGTPLWADITLLNLNIANTSMEYVYYRNDDGTQTKSKTKILVFKITLCLKKSIMNKENFKFQKFFDWRNKLSLT